MHLNRRRRGQGEATTTHTIGKAPQDVDMVARRPPTDTVATETTTGTTGIDTTTAIIGMIAIGGTTDMDIRRAIDTKGATTTGIMIEGMTTAMIEGMTHMRQGIGEIAIIHPVTELLDMAMIFTDKQVLHWLSLQWVCIHLFHLFLITLILLDMQRRIFNRCI